MTEAGIVDCGIVKSTDDIIWEALVKLAAEQYPKHDTWEAVYQRFLLECELWRLSEVDDW
tara:strand:- start:1547 stop:1726 length:180 start_codon:yes stop_codon:yes gene_type:complete